MIPKGATLTTVKFDGHSRAVDALMPPAQVAVRDVFDRSFALWTAERLAVAHGRLMDAEPSQHRVRLAQTPFLIRAPTPCSAIWGSSRRSGALRQATFSHERTFMRWRA